MSVPQAIAPSAAQRAIPNALTTGRLIAAGAVIWMLGSLEPLSPSRLLWAAGLFIAAAVTDALDGFLARRWNAVSKFGRVADPLADKILVLGAFVCLAGPAFVRNGPDGPWQQSAVTPVIASIILARELLVTSLRGLIEGSGADFSASASGKAKMVLQSVCIPLVLIVLATQDTQPGSTARTVLTATAWLTTAVTAISAWPYIARAATLSRTPA